MSCRHLFDLAERYGKSVRDAVGLHLLFLVGLDANVAQRASGAQQSEFGLGVLGIVAERCGLVDFATEQAACTRDAPALKTTIRKLDTGIERGLQNKLGGAAGNRDFHAARHESDLIFGIRVRHARLR